MLRKISPDMLPVMVASVDMDGMDVKEISAFADETVMPVSYTHLPARTASCWM